QNLAGITAVGSNPPSALWAVGGAGTIVHAGTTDVNTSTSLTVTPGLYGKLDSSGNGTILTLNSGTYVVTNEMVASGGGQIVGNGPVTVYLTCSGYSTSNTAPCGGAGGSKLTESGSSSLNISAPTSGPYS